MFSTLGQNSLFYILDKNNKPSLKIGKVKEIKINPQSYGLVNQQADIFVDVNGDNYEFKNIPTNVSIYSPSIGIIISDNTDSMIKEFESILSHSQEVLNSIDYHKSILDSKDKIMSYLNPKFAKEKEQENKIIALETKVNNIENGISDMKTMMSELLNKTIKN